MHSGALLTYTARPLGQPPEGLWRINYLSRTCIQTLECPKSIPSLG